MTITLRVDATSSGPALVLRPWHADDVGPLVEVYRDPALRRWTSLPVENAADAMRWLERLELLHQEDNIASCRVAEKAGYRLDQILPASPPSFPRDGHLHVRQADAPPTRSQA